MSKNAALIISTFLALLCLSSCNNGHANVASSQNPFFTSAPGSPINLACGPSTVAAGDLNHDSKTDLVVACGQSRSISVLLGTGGGKFGAPKQVAVPDTPDEIALGDVNGDSNPDLAICSHDSYGVVLMLGDGKGGLAPAPSSPIVMKQGGHPHTHGVALGDLNGDRHLDLITVNSSDNDVSIAFGDGRGRFTRAAATFPVGPSPYPFGLGDVNKDGRLDIVATATATGPMRAQQLPSSFALTLLLNDGQGGFRRSELPLRTGQPWSVAIGELNGDFKMDLVATHHDQSKLTVLLGDGAGGFKEAAGSPFEFGGNASKVTLADVNHDGHTDVLAAAGDGVGVMLGDGRGNFKLAPGSPLTTGRGVWRLELAELSGDSKLDLVTTNLESRTISILLGR